MPKKPDQMQVTDDFFVGFLFAMESATVAEKIDKLQKLLDDSRVKFSPKMQLIVEMYVTTLGGITRPRRRPRR